MWQRFTVKARSVVFEAQTVAASYHSSLVSSQHLLLAILARRDTVGARLLDSMQVDITALETTVRAATANVTGQTSLEMYLSDDAHQSIDFAYDESQRLGDNYIGTEHLLLGLIHRLSNDTSQALVASGIDLEKVRQALVEFRENVPPTADDDWSMFTENARRAVFLAQEEAGRFCQQTVSTEHLLLAILRNDDPFTEATLRRLGLSREAVRAGVDNLAARGNNVGDAGLQASAGLLRTLDLAREEVLAVHRRYVGTDFLLIGLIREGEGVAARVLAAQGVTLQVARDAAFADWSAGVPQSQPPEMAG